MSEQHIRIYRLKLVSIFEAVVIACLTAVVFYLAQFAHQASSITISSGAAASVPVSTIPNATSTPTLDMQVPPAKNAKIQLPFDSI